MAKVIALGLMMLAGGATLVSVLMSGEPQTDPDVMMHTFAGAGFAALIGIVLFSLLMMAMQFAPMLVFFRSVPPLHAMKLSLRAFLHNVGPMLVYGLTLMLLAVLASLPMFLGWVVLLPLIFTSLYASYSDIFPPLKEVSTPPESVATSQNDPSYF